MGYSEIHCQLCGVSFNVGRVRRAGEPLNTAFSYAEQGLFLGYNFVNKEAIERDRCPSDSGCSNVKTTKRKALRPENADRGMPQTGDDNDDDGDDDWEYQSEESNEPLEWEEDDDDEDASETSDSETEEGSVSSPWIINDNANPRFIRAGISSLSIVTDELCTPESSEDGDDSDGDFLETYRRCNELEHLAGPGCIHGRGYNGNNITAEEMFGSNTAQCLVRKDCFDRAELGTVSTDEDFEPEPDDEDFELSGDYVLSGLGGQMRSRDDAGLRVSPIRHRLFEELQPDNIIWEPENVPSMPFHPACLEVYKRVSQSRFGKFNLNGLWQWRVLDCNSSSKRQEGIGCLDPAVQRAREQWHCHWTGDEWIAANPLFVPALPQILKNAVHDNAATLNPRNSAFSARRADTKSNSRIAESQDCFRILPQEVLFLIVDRLSSQEIAALRLVSRMFTHLPILLWKTLLKREMPWLWEVWDHSKPYKWTAISVSEMQAERNRIEKEIAEKRSLKRLHRQIFEEEMPENWEQYCQNHPWLTQDTNTNERFVIGQAISRLAESRSMYSLPEDRTNWYEAYRLVTKHWGDLKGLRNRQRIWKACQDISSRIEELTEEGKIDK